MKLGTTPYSIGLSRLIPFIFSAGLISTISVLPKAKTAETSVDPVPEKKTSNATSSVAFRKISRRLMRVGWVFVCRDEFQDLPAQPRVCL